MGRAKQSTGGGEEEGRRVSSDLVELVYVHLGHFLRVDTVHYVLDALAVDSRAVRDNLTSGLLG